jgi:hypothetical protein
MFVLGGGQANGLPKFSGNPRVPTPGVLAGLLNNELPKSPPGVLGASGATASFPARTCPNVAFLTDPPGVIIPLGIAPPPNAIDAVAGKNGGLCPGACPPKILGNNFTALCCASALSSSPRTAK